MGIEPYLPYVLGLISWTVTGIVYGGLTKYDPKEANFWECLIMLPFMVFCGMLEPFLNLISCLGRRG